MEWQPISEAPNDKTPVLVFLPSQHLGGCTYPSSQCVAYKDGEYKWQLTETGGYAIDADVWPYPTYFMPLPDPPKE